MESFEGIYLDLSKQSGKCRIAESGLGWKPLGGGDTFTLDGRNVINAQWSRAARGHELRIMARPNNIIQLDGFREEVRFSLRFTTCASSVSLSVLTKPTHRTLTASQKLSSYSTALPSTTRNMHSEDGTGEKANSARPS